MDSKQFRQHQEHWERAVISYKDDKGKSFGGTVVRLAVALKLYEHASDDGDQCMMYARRSTLATAAGFNGKAETRRREVSRCLRALKKAGFIELVREAQRPTFDNPNGVPAKWKLVIPPAELDRVVHMWDAEGLGGIPYTVTSNDGKNSTDQEGLGYETYPLTGNESSPITGYESHTQYTLTTHPDQYTQTDHAQSENLARNDEPSGNDPHAQNLSFEQRDQSFSQTEEQPEPTDINDFLDMEKERREEWEDRYNDIAPGSMIETISYDEAVETFYQHFYSARRRHWDRPFMAYLNSLAADGSDLADGDMSELASAVQALLATIPKSQFYDERRRIEPDSDNEQQPEQTSDYRPF
ncbi:hypothetical protein NQ011_01310 [Corynebacterium phoceense]|uniref:hypothetical protein n=1 Tax=Corynebacterium phoceense TaxID=1686286 RepID=UPI00211C08BD|nr:hypothetical protein [Corynebacterium phoceense]MCQ9335352.1 hypothetical protein [Corynebacterium phoceense]